MKSFLNFLKSIPDKKKCIKLEFFLFKYLLKFHSVVEVAIVVTMASSVEKVATIQTTNIYSSKGYSIQKQ